ncbi:23S rRNA (pseudouridine(1915)-N(3))-methyltransferase RlmH [Granulicatella sp. zg-ZJ]|uniref:23S rRNA (pseudouridine(1915)-N(3))-methyltransferase RlmH n=1 Tax=unclassified Granulicatella TaxID=2630493 RepID=UPI0013C06B89|nr:23S rRNA (pseudouridine(1915)-N(3))-methyltransferase RlmH [Carnobacteriaceae bacterium zg-ZUI78]NEW62404.1 23S rRNA (pseudouridine(1915)-N(3))-methyltransferase RlmH [Granulicatella sp. zg-ZJ]NEW66347.1 23S rRNA (pseudouridine(1915)-N(3))-methyltransferase RlmH [Granulicatella sp. zg-84]QMI86478.1 23S rRNA (pseudouridine(1915)-N(3))-methyltransferase RlmH [Carnobacteriaceae bacterium zg-84]
MNIKIIAVGKLKEKYLKQAIDEYSKRLGAYCKFDIIEVPDEKTPDNMSEKEKELVKQKEGDRILSKISEQDIVITLAIEGQLVTSETIAEKIEQYALHGKSRLSFIIGGSLGLSDDVKKRANELFSFGRITMPHQLIRVVLSEQIYRAYRIINNQAYHK